MVGVLGGRAMAAATSSLVGTDGAASSPRLRLAILLCNVAARRLHLGDPQRWTRDAILRAVRSPPPKRDTS